MMNDKNIDRQPIRIHSAVKSSSS